MQLYLLTCPDSYSRAIVAAPSERKAKGMRPDGAFWSNGLWRIAKSRRVAMFRDTVIVAAKPLPGWADNAKDVDAMNMGRAKNFVSETVWCYEPHDNGPRQ